MASEEQQVRELISKVGARPDDVKHIRHAFELHYYGHQGKGDGEGRARRTIANIKSMLTRNGLDPQGVYYQPLDSQDSSKGGMVVILDSTWDKKSNSRPGEKATFKVEDRFYFGKGRKERFGASDKVDSLIATAYRALRNGDKAAARRLIASAEALVQSDSSVPNYIVNELKDLKKSLSF